MGFARLCSVILLALSLVVLASRGVDAAPAMPPVPIFLDTDVCVDPGDVSAVTLLNGLANRGEARILGITCVTSFPYAPGCVDAVCCWCGRSDVPIGSLKDSGFLDESKYAQYVANNWPNRYPDGSRNVPDAVALFRRVVSNQPDHSVVMVAIGPARNLAHFLQSKADSASPLSGRDLIAMKVKHLSFMAGAFSKTRRIKDQMGKDYGPSETFIEWNVQQDIPAFQYVVKNWPTPIMFSGFEIGQEILVDGSMVTATPQSPQAYCVPTTQRAFGYRNVSRPAWDQTAILYGVRGLSNYWGGAMEGRVVVDDQGHTIWRADPTRHQGFLEPKMSDAELGEIISQIQAEAGQIKPLGERGR